MPLSRSKRTRTDIDPIAAEAFIRGAADQAPAKAVRKQFALRFDVNQMRDVDRIAKRRGMTRNALIAFWVSRGIEEDG
jgi:hypothetical protein